MLLEHRRRLQHGTPTYCLCRTLVLPTMSVKSFNRVLEDFHLYLQDAQHCTTTVSLCEDTVPGSTSGASDINTQFSRRRQSEVSKTLLTDWDKRGKADCRSEAVSN